MRTAVWLAFILGLLNIVHSGTAPSEPNKSAGDALVLRVRVVSIKNESSPGTSVIAMTAALRMDLHNEGKKPVILLIEKAPLCVRAVLTKSSGAAVGDNILFDEYRGPSVATSPDWEIFRRALDQPKPPVEMTQIVKPGESWATDSFVVMRPPVKLERYRVDRPPISWRLLRESSPVWLRVECDAWPLNVERQPTSGKIRFGRELQKRWHEFGKLQLDSVVSEPIEVELPDQ